MVIEYRHHLSVAVNSQEIETWIANFLSRELNAFRCPSHLVIQEMAADWLIGPRWVKKR